MGQSKKRRAQVTKSPSRLPRLATVAVVIMGLAVGWATFRTPSRREPRREHPGIDATPSITRVNITTLRELQQQFGEMLALVAPLDPEAAALRAFHDQHASYGVFDRPGHMFFGGAFIPPSPEVRAAHDFGIVVASLEERRRNGYGYEMQWEYSTGYNVLSVPRPESVDPAIGGAMFCHELTHVRDLLTGIEPDSLARTDPAFAEGEVRAHQLEIRLFEAISQGRYRALLGESLDRLTDVVTSSGWLTTHSDRTIAEVDRIDAAAFPPVRSEDERSSRRGRHFHALNYLLAERNGLGREGMIAFEQHQMGILDGMVEEETRP